MKGRLRPVPPRQERQTCQRPHRPLAVEIRTPASRQRERVGAAVEEPVVGADRNLDPGRSKVALFARTEIEAVRAIGISERRHRPIQQAGQLRMVIDRTFPLAEAAAALRYLMSGRPVGRVVITVDT